VNDTLAYGSYMMRAYASMQDPFISATIKGSGITIDRPCDMHVTSNGLLSWVNSGTSLSFCQVSLGDPITADPAFVRLVNFPSGMGLSNSDRAFGIAMNSNNEVFVSDNNSTKYGNRAHIAKYSTATESWVADFWASDTLTALNYEDEFMGLFIDDQDSVYVACPTGVTGGGAGGWRETLTRWKDLGTRAVQANNAGDWNTDYSDVAATWLGTGNSSVYGLDRAIGQIDSYTNALVASGTIYNGPNSNEGGLWINHSGYLYLSDNTQTIDRFFKIAQNGAVVYTLSDKRINNASGITVWEKNSTNETFVCAAGRDGNSISIYKEPVEGDTPTFVREIADDVYSLIYPEGVAVDPESSVYAVARTSKSVKKFSKDGVFQPLVDAANGLYIKGTDNSANLDDSTGFLYPRALAVGADGSIYVFDHNTATTGPTATSLKKFTPAGAPVGVICDVDATLDANATNRVIIAANYANSSIYAVTLSDGARVIRFSDTGSVLQHLGNLNLADGNPPEGQTAADALGVAVGPYFDSTANSFYSDAVYILIRTNPAKVEVWRKDFSVGRLTTITLPQPLSSTPTTNAQTFLVDNFGDIYVMLDTGSNFYDARRYRANTADAGTTDCLMSYRYTRGTGSSQFYFPRQAVWTDNRGVFKYNGSTGYQDIMSEQRG